MCWWWVWFEKAERNIEYYQERESVNKKMKERLKHLDLMHIERDIINFFGYSNPICIFFFMGGKGAKLLHI